MILSCSGAQKSKLKAPGRTHTLQRLEGEPSSLSQGLVASGGPRLVVLTPVSASVFTWPSAPPSVSDLPLLSPSLFWLPRAWHVKPPEQGLNSVAPCSDRWGSPFPPSSSMDNVIGLRPTVSRHDLSP